MTATTTPALPAALHERLAEAFPGSAPDYDNGYRDALASIALALTAAGVSQTQLEDAITTALDAFGNNAC